MSRSISGQKPLLSGEALFPQENVLKGNPPAVVGGAERSSADKPKIRTNKKDMQFS